ncbi:MAG: hypothetical protein Q8937_09230 [Bacteroidota bacterium]|nr:hypothetical protein [Bacteroidota bacterium]
MKNNLLHACARLSAGSLVLFLFGGCFKDKVTMTYKILTPVYATQTAVMGNIKGNPAQPFDSVGKIAMLGNYVFVNEVYKGIHVIDNSNPGHPAQIAFLNIPGNVDMAIRGNMLYADMYSSLLSIDITDPRSPKVTSILSNLFRTYNATGGYLIYDNSGNLTNNTRIITGWVMKDTTVPVGSSIYYNGGGPMYYDLAGSVAQASAASSTGTVGSMSKMAILNNYLYTIDEAHEAGALSLADPKTPAATRISLSGFDLETIFPFGNKLFLGSKEGVFIYDVSDPSKPQQQGTFSHGSACDPVISDGDYAYVTLHSGTYCGGASNELDVVNVQNLNVPILVSTYPMTRPQGLTKDGNLLFVCDGQSGGVKLFNATDPKKLQLLGTIGQMSAYDVISDNHHLMVVAADGLYQYDYSDPQHVQPLSTLTLK